MYHNCAIFKSSNSLSVRILRCWGYNLYGQTDLNLVHMNSNGSTGTNDDYVRNKNK